MQVATEEALKMHKSKQIKSAMYKAPAGKEKNSSITVMFLHPSSWRSEALRCSLQASHLQPATKESRNTFSRKSIDVMKDNDAFRGNLSMIISFALPTRHLHIILNAVLKSRRRTSQKVLRLWEAISELKVP